MKAIQLMMNEHDNIRRMLKVMDKIVEENTINEDDINKIVDFCINYSDLHHHNKEEKILFPEMLLANPMQFDGMINGVMLYEHDEGRRYISLVKSGLEENNNSLIIKGLQGYSQLLKEHTEKEDECLYVFANEALSLNAKEKVDALCFQYENLKEEENIQEYYLSLLNQLEEKYL